MRGFWRSYKHRLSDRDTASRISRRRRISQSLSCSGGTKSPPEACAAERRHRGALLDDGKADHPAALRELAGRSQNRKASCRCLNDSLA